jgi:hypothetical protein
MNDQTRYIEGDTIVVEEAEPVETEQSAAFDAWLAEAGKADGGTPHNIRVFRAPTEHRGTETFLFKCEPSDFTPDMMLVHLRDKYGTGDYRIKCYNEKTRLVFNKGVSVEKTESEDENKGNSELSLVIQSLAEAQQRQQEQTNLLLEKLSNGPTNQQPSMIEMMTAMATMMSAIQQPQAPQETIKDKIELFQLLQGNQAPQMGIGEILEVATKLADMKGGGDGEGVDLGMGQTLLGAVKELAPAIMAHAENTSEATIDKQPAPPVKAGAQRHRPRPMPTRVLAPLNLNAQTAQHSATGEPTEEEVMFIKMMLKQKLPELLAHIQDKTPAATVAQGIVDLASPEQIQGVLKSGVIAQIVEESDDARPHSAWFQQLEQSLNDLTS